MKYQANIITRPTTDFSNVSYGNGDYFYSSNLINMKNPSHTNQHLYVTVDQDVEPIKEGDWCINPKGYPEVFGYDYRAIYSKEEIFNCKKIIAATDPKLTIMLDYHGVPTADITKECYYGVAQLQQSFLEEYIANSDGKFEIEYDLFITDKKDEVSDLDININEYRPKLNQDNTVNITSVEEKMYSREEVEILITKYADDEWGALSSKVDIENFNNWIKENL